jgi:hypothetical protein
MLTANRLVVWATVTRHLSIPRVSLSPVASQATAASSHSLAPASAFHSAMCTSSLHPFSLFACNAAVSHSRVRTQARFTTPARRYSLFGFFGDAKTSDGATPAANKTAKTAPPADTAAQRERDLSEVQETTDNVQEAHDGEYGDDDDDDYEDDDDEPVEEDWREPLELSALPRELRGFVQRLRESCAELEAQQSAPSTVGHADADVMPTEVDAHATADRSNHAVFSLPGR